MKKSLFAFAGALLAGVAFAAQPASADGTPPGVPQRAPYWSSAPRTSPARRVCMAGARPCPRSASTVRASITPSSPWHRLRSRRGSCTAKAFVHRSTCRVCASTGWSGWAQCASTAPDNPEHQLWSASATSSSRCRNAWSARRLARPTTP